LPNFNLIKKTPLCVVITHGHLDHVGALPIFSKMFPNVTIYATRPTKDFMLMQWEDTINIAKHSNKPPIFSVADADLCRKNIKIINVGQKKKLGGDVSVKFVDAGHILGAASPLFTYKGKTVLVTGDFSYQDQTIVSGAKFKGVKADYVISEATYLTRSRASLDLEKSRFVSDVFRILNRGGKVLIPAFSIGRSQEAFEILKSAGVSDEFDMWIDGSAMHVSMIYKFYLPDEIDPNIQEHFVSDDDQGDHRRCIKFKNGPCVVIAPSGMLEGGHAVSYAKAWMDKEENAILFPGYLQPDSLGFKVCHSSLGEQIDFPPMIIKKKNKEPKAISINCARRCEIQSYQFSAHVFHDDLLKVWQGLNSQKLVLVHGESASIDWAVQNPNDILLGLEVIGPQNGEKVVLED